MSVSLDNHPVLAENILGGLRLIEADAGTGKTWTIARLVLRAIVEKNIGIDQIAVLTFTKAAAAELRERIGTLFDQWLTDSPVLEQDPFTAAWVVPVEPAVLKARLRLARLQLDNASIGTIDGFCHRIMTENALSMGRIDRPRPGPSDSQPLKEAIAGWWRENIVQDTSGFAQLCGSAGLSRSGLAQLLEPALQDSQAVIHLPANSGDLTTLVQRLGASVSSAQQTLTDEYDVLLQWAQGTTGLNKTKYGRLSEQIVSARQWLDDYPASIDRDCNGLLLLDRRRINDSWNQKADRSFADQLKTPDAVSDLLGLLRERSALPSSIASSIRAEISEAVNAIERTRGTISFDDMLEQTRAALYHTELGEQLGRLLRDQFLLTFVDEFQDTDPAQWAIFEKIYRPNGTGLEQGCAPGTGLILVGDPKQAIYSFRNADINTYLAARDLCETTYRLEQNHRSNGALIAAVNAVFSRDVPFATPQIAFTPAIPGLAATDQSQEPPDDERGALTFIELGDADKPAEKLSATELEQRSVRSTCDEIAKLVTNASARAADIAVLVPSAARGGKIRDGLSERGIGAVEIRRDSVFSTSDARDLFRIVSAIAAPASVDLARGALVTSLVGLDLNDLNAMTADPAHWQKLLVAFDDASNRWLSDGPQASLRGLIFGHFERSEQLMSVSEGERRLTNLLHLMSLLNDEPAARGSAAQGQAWLGRQIQMSADPDSERASEERQLRLESDDDLVRITTIHTSKGLQYPFVFLPFAYAAPRSIGTDVYRVHTDSHQRFIVDANAGPWVYDKNTSEIANFKGAAIQERFQEDIRLAYVSLTRAQRRCYVCWGPVDRVREPIPMSWLLDRECPVPSKAFRYKNKDKNEQRIDEQRVLDTQRRIASEHDAVTILNWQQISAFTQPLIKPTSPTRPELTLSELSQNIGSSWHSRSFTSLARAAQGGVTDQPDHDQDQFSALIELADLPIDANRSQGMHSAALTFPRGANSGTGLHTILENIPFDRPVDSREVKTVLDQYGLSADSEQVSNWLTQVLNSPLPDPVSQNSAQRLAEIHPDNTIRELRYTLSASQLTPASLADSIRRFYPIPVLSGSTYDGFLTGYIDLIVRTNEGRYWVIDYKSNWLGDSAGDYSPALLNHAMSEHAYTLQMCLYSLAVHRMLRQKQHDYDYEKHFGGVWYLFLRGMGAGEPFNGVYAAKPPLALLDELDHLVGMPNV